MKLFTLTNIIKDTDPIAKYIIILDKEGNAIKKVKEYNNETKEAILYSVDKEGKILVDWKNPKQKSILPKYKGQSSEEYGRYIVTETKVLDSSKIMFKSFSSE